MPTNYYSILQVHTDAEQEIIEAAYRRLARKYHPDTNRASAPDATMRMQKINEAYEVLADCEKRRLYDQENRHKLSDAHELRHELELLQNQLMDEQIAREEQEEELASAVQELRIEQLRRKRAERKSVRLADQLKNEWPKIHHHPQAPAADLYSKSAHLRLQRKCTILETEVAEERFRITQMGEELSIAAADLTFERAEREKADKKVARLEQLLAAERKRREAFEEEMRLAEYERQAKEKAEVLRGVKPMSSGRDLAEERIKREQAEQELAAIQGILRNLSKELRTDLGAYPDHKVKSTTPQPPP